MTLLTHLSDLLKRAKLATPGPWSHDGPVRPPFAIVGIDVENTYAIAWCDRNNTFRDKKQAKFDHAYVSSLPPEVITALVQAVKASAEYTAYKPVEGSEARHQAHHAAVESLTKLTELMARCAP